MTAETQRRTFDPAAPLPRGTTVLEASAGTGKTWAMATIAMRCVAEGRAGIDQIMMVTFTRAATLEMRTRVRDRLVAAEAFLDAPGDATDDPALRALLVGEPDEVTARRDRLRAALSGFDRAMIATTHEFCGAMVSGLGVLADHSPADAMVTESDALTEEAAADLFVRKYVRGPSAPTLTWGTARSLAHEAVRAVGGLVPDPADAAVAALPGVADRVRFARAVRTEVARRKRGRGWWSFEDMLARVLAALERPEAVSRLREMFPVVLVDEFQDTDPVQWEVLRRAFVGGPSDLVLIGDPKQAIYGFRNAEVRNYLRAVEHADQRLTLDTNRRSDPAVLRGLDALFTGAQLGDARIVAGPVRGHRTEERLTSPDPDRGPGVRVRVRPPDGTQRWAQTLQNEITADVVAEVRAHLDGARLRRGETDRPVVADDIAVIVGTHRRADEITAALRRAGIASVRPQADSVFASEAAEHWLALLEALDGLRERPVRRAALTWFVGWTLPELAAADDTALSALSATLQRWSRAAEQSVAELLATMLRDGLAERVLATDGGERVLTDLRHVAQALLTEQRRRGATVAGLHTWLAARREEVERVSGEWSRRLETDRGAVSVMTVHHAKGLQYPVVLAPDLWRLSGWFPEEGVLRLHDEAENPVFDVGGAAAPGRRDRLAIARSESAGESLRQAYVAATRAECALVVWWASNRRLSAEGALGRLLARDPSTGAVPDQVDPTAVPVETPALRVQTIAPGPRGVPRARAASGPELVGGEQVDAPLRARRLTRPVDLGWRRTSYSGLTAAAHDTGVGSEPPDLIDDEAIDATTSTVDDAELDVSPGLADTPGAATPSPMADLPGGTAFGTIVHTVLEYADTDVADLRAEVSARSAEVLARMPLPGLSAEDLVEPLLGALRTPFGALAPGLDLASVRREDHLPELAFEYPLGEGTRGRWLYEVADLVAHHLPADDPLATYPDRLRTPGLGDQSLRGFLTGSIDAVVRVDAGTDRVRHLVVDHKTNRLAPPGVDLTVGHYTSAAMAEAMMLSHYPLQALLYAVALHRFLRWRQPGYDPERHLGGVLYLFVRGMAGPDTPSNGGRGGAAAPCGVFSWRPPSALVSDLSDLLAALPDDRDPGEAPDGR